MLKVKLNPPVAITSIIIVGFLTIFGVFWPSTAERVFQSAQNWMLGNFGWVYMAGVAVFMVACLVFALSRYGRIKLGPDDSEPEFSFIAWSAMLFAAGMGVGLMFYGVGEPMSHYLSPPHGEGGTVAAQQEAMSSTMFHWGIAAWSIFAIVGLTLGYFGYRYNLPLTIRSGLYPLLKERIYGPIGHAVDIFAIVGTIFGISTSLGLGVMQMNTGLEYLYGVDQSTTLQIGIIFGVMIIASISVVSGLDKGVRILSEFNLLMAMVLMLFVLVLGPTIHLINAMLDNLSLYLSEVFPRTVETFTYEPTPWFETWTLFYWAWWISWSPFVGMFIARISRGRTIREFVLGALLVPTTLILVWMTVFGNTAFWLDTGEADGALGAAVNADITVALFQFLDYFPLSTLTSTFAMIILVVFFITSADSGSLVLDTLASGGKEGTPAYQRLFWCFLVAAIASVLLAVGGLTALQAATTASALPFVLVLVMLCIGLGRGLSADYAGRVLLEQRQTSPRFVGGDPLSWRQRLNTLIKPPQGDSVRQFMTGTVHTAMEKVAAEFRTNGYDAEVVQGEDDIRLEMHIEKARDFVYGVQLKSAPLPGFILGGVEDRATAERRIWAAVTYFFDGRRGYNIMGYRQEQVITDILDQYEIYRRIARSPETELYVTSPDPDREMAK